MAPPLNVYRLKKRPGQDCSPDSRVVSFKKRKTSTVYNAAVISSKLRTEECQQVISGDLGKFQSLRAFQRTAQAT